MNMVLMFENNKGKEIYLGDFETRQEAFKKMMDFLANYDFKVYYTRIAYYKDRGYLWIDFGSHSSFFHLYGTEEECLGVNSKGNNDYPCVAGVDEHIDPQALQEDLELPCYIELGNYSIVYDTKNHLEINIPDSHFLSNRDLSSILAYVMQVYEK